MPATAGHRCPAHYTSCFPTEYTDFDRLHFYVLRLYFTVSDHLISTIDALYFEGSGLQREWETMLAGRTMSSYLWVCTDLQRGVSRLFPQLHNHPVFDRGRAHKAWSSCGNHALRLQDIKARLVELVICWTYLQKKQKQ